MHRSVIVVVAIAALCAGPADASRRLTENDRLKYDTGDAALVAGLETFGLSVWIKRSAADAPLEVREIVHNGNPQNEDGFRLVLNEPANLLRFVYHGALAGGGEGPLAVNVPLDEVPLDAWFHAAVDLDLAGGEVRIFVDGTTSASAFLADGGFAPMDGNRRLYLGDRPGSVSLGFAGDLHDACIVDHLWADPEIALLQTFSARDVTPGIIFNPRLRKTADDALFSGLAATGSPSLTRGIGPPIIYVDQRPTVVVIGDTQELDDTVGGTDPGEAVEMTRIGRFVHEYRDSLRIAAVFHVGDWIDVGSVGPQQVVRARALVDEFRHDGIPWSCTIGNHDYGDIATRDVAFWSSETAWTMPPSLFDQEPWHVAKLSDVASEPPVQDRDYAHAFRFDLDGQSQLGISLPNAPTMEMLEWASDVAALHADEPVWLVTHQHVRNDGILRTEWDIDSSEAPGFPGGPRDVMLEYFEHMPNLAMVFSGHYTAIADRRCDNSQVAGATMPAFYSMIVNAQHTDFDAGEPGDHDDDGRGFLQLMSVDAQTGHVDVESYIALMDAFHEPDDPRFDFEIQLGEHCDAPDCNGNLYHDYEDILWGWSDDCDLNLQPDECQPTLICALGLSEVRIGPGTSEGRFEYVEITGAPGTPLDDIQYIVLGDDGQEGDSGRVEVSVRLSGQIENESGYYLVAGPDFELGTPDLVADLPFDAFDNTTHLLVQAGANIMAGTDLDIDDDGELDVMPWIALWGEVAFVDDDTGGEHTYTDNRYGPDDDLLSAPRHLFDCENTYYSSTCPSWRVGASDPADGIDSPGVENARCDCCDPDVDGDGTVDFVDLINLLAQWGPCGGCSGDIDADGLVGFEDVLYMLSSWGPCP